MIDAQQNHVDDLLVKAERRADPHLHPGMASSRCIDQPRNVVRRVPPGREQVWMDDDLTRSRQDSGVDSVTDRGG